MQENLSPRTVFIQNRIERMSLMRLGRVLCEEGIVTMVAKSSADPKARKKGRSLAFSEAFPEGDGSVCPNRISDSRVNNPIIAPSWYSKKAKNVLRWGMVRRRSPQLILILSILGGLTVAFVGWEVLERYLFPDLSIGLRHFLLTVRAGLTTVIGCLVVYLVMHRQRQRLSDTAEHLARLLESYMTDPNSTDRFENPHLLHCRDVLGCVNKQCPVSESPGERCWQVMALGGNSHEHHSPRIEIEKCHECIVFRLSCPDKLTELGESFNNLMFLLKAEAEQVGRMRTQMLEKEKMASIGQLASGIAHEVGNPLSSISSIVQMLKRSGMNGTTDEQLDLIQTHIKRITQTVRQLVKLARPGKESWELIDICSALEETVLLISFDPRAHDVEIHFEPPRSLPLTYGMPGQLQQVFITLSINALDAMLSGGTLTIKAEKEGDKIVVRIRDTGCGMPPETGRRIFDPFFTTKEPGRGSGLGLSVSYGIVQKLHGTIEYFSTLGRGTEFVICLPILKKAPEAYHHDTRNHTPGG